MTNNQNFKTPKGWVLVTDASNMTDEQAEFLATEVNVCGGIAYDLYRKLLEVSPKFQAEQENPDEVQLEDCDQDGWYSVPENWDEDYCLITMSSTTKIEVQFRNGEKEIDYARTRNINWRQDGGEWHIVKYRFFN